MVKTAKEKKTKIKKCKYGECENFYYGAKRFCSSTCKIMHKFFVKLNHLVDNVIVSLDNVQNINMKRTKLKLGMVQTEYEGSSIFLRLLLSFLRYKNFVDYVWISHVKYNEGANYQSESQYQRQSSNSSSSDPWEKPESNGHKEWEHLFSLLSKDDLKAFKHLLAKRYHPDLHKDKMETMKQLNDLFDRLLK